MIHVCVIGAGAAGLAAARYLTAAPELFSTTVFEQTENIGGTWVYTDKVGKDEYGLPIHSSMYKNMRTDLPRHVMAFPDFAFPVGERSFLHHTEVRKYLESYAEHFKLHPFIKFQHHVKSVQPRRLEKQLQWEVIVEDLRMKKETKYKFDSVMVCNGHFSVPAIPSIPGIEKFQGKVMHSHNYRCPEPFTGQEVMLLGAGPSGLDISLELCTVAKKVYLSHNYPMEFPEFPNNLQQVKGVVAAIEKGFQMKDESSCEVDTVIFCTGYEYTYPFLHQDCHVTVENHQVKLLYKHMIHTEFPSLCFIGIGFRVIPFPHFSYQVQFFLKVLDGTIKLPTKCEMDEDMPKELKKREEMGWPAHHLHCMNDLQWEYNEELADALGLQHQPDVHKKILTAVVKNLFSNYPTFKKYKYMVCDSTTFEAELEKSLI